MLVSSPRSIPALVLAFLLVAAPQGAYSQTQSAYAALAAKVHSKLAADDALAGLTIEVKAKAGVVTLSGTVNNKAAQELAAMDAQCVPGAKSVKNLLVVGAAPVAKASTPSANAPSVIPSSDGSLPPIKLPTHLTPEEFAEGKRFFLVKNGELLECNRFQLDNHLYCMPSSMERARAIMQEEHQYYYLHPDVVPPDSATPEPAVTPVPAATDPPPIKFPTRLTQEEYDKGDSFFVMQNGGLLNCYKKGIVYCYGVTMEKARAIMEEQHQYYYLHPDVVPPPDSATPVPSASAPPK